MPQIIVIETLERSSSPRKLFEALQAAGVEDALLIGKALPKGTVDKSHFISSSKGKVAKAFERALKKVSDKKIVILNSEAGLSEKQIRSILSETGDREADTINYAAIKSDRTVIDFPEQKTSSLVPWLAANRPFPGMCIAAGRQMCSKVTALGAESAIELMAQILLVSAASGRQPQRLGEQLKISPEALVIHPLQLTASECARCLTAVVESCNIEELFPSHAWDKHQEESLAACYHTLAAMFIRLGDYDSARELLVQADQFEDSPRSLALRGILCARKSDWLNSAANLIASLQQYEARMREAEGHYVKFNPRDFQKINSVLLSGLDALNHKNNRIAVQHFAEAIFLYDSFYHENGVANLKAVD